MVKKKQNPYIFSLQSALLLKRIIIIICCWLVVGSVKGQQGWPLKNYIVETVLVRHGNQLMPVEIEIKDFLLQDSRKYYRENTQNKDFKKDITVYKNSNYVIKVAFTTGKFSDHQQYQLQISSHAWISTEKCLSEGEIKYPVVVNANGDKDLFFNLKPGCSNKENIIINFVILKNKQVIKHTKQGSVGEAEQGRIEFKVPIKISKYTKEELEAKRQNSKKNERLEEWFEKEFEKIKTDIGTNDPLAWIEPLEKLSREQKDGDKAAIIQKNISSIRKNHLHNTVLKSDPCLAWVKEFQQTEHYKALADADKTTYQNHINNCQTGKGGTPPPDKAKEAWQKAKDKDIVKAYEKYISDYPNGDFVEEANSKISELKQKDRRAWDLVVAEENADPCEYLDAINEYLSNTQHHVIYRKRAGERRKDVSEKCNEPRVLASSFDETNGIYIFDIINSASKYSSKDEKLTFEGNQVTVEILEEGDYSFTITDQNNTKLLIEFTAGPPEFSFTKKDDYVIIKSGKGPFTISDPITRKQATFNERKIKIDNIIEKLNINLEQSSEVVLTDSKLQEKLTLDLGEGGTSWLGIIIALIMIVLGLYYFREPILAFFNKNRKETKVWQTAKKSNIWRMYEKYFEEFGVKGAYYKEFKKKREEHEVYSNCKTERDYQDYINDYPEGMHLKEAKSKIQTTEKTKTPAPAIAGIDFIEDTTEEASNTKNKDIITTYVPSEVNNTHYKFDLMTHWSSSMVREIYISREAVMEADDLIVDATRTARRQKEVIPEVGGFLLGKIYRPQKDYYQLIIERFISVTPENNGEYEVAFGRTAFMQLEEAMFDTYKEENLKMVGWMHTHPGHGLFLSGKDIEVIENHFRKPYQVSMEVETKTIGPDTAFFTRKQDLTLNNQRDRNTDTWFEWRKANLWSINNF